MKQQHKGPLTPSLAYPVSRLLDLFIHLTPFTSHFILRILYFYTFTHYVDTHWLRASLFRLLLVAFLEFLAKIYVFVTKVGPFLQKLSHNPYQKKEIQPKVDLIFFALFWELVADWSQIKYIFTSAAVYDRLGTARWLLSHFSVSRLFENKIISRTFAGFELTINIGAAQVL